MSNKTNARINLRDMNSNLRMERTIKEAMKANKAPISTTKPKLIDEKPVERGLKEFNYQLQIDKILNEAAKTDKTKPRRIASVVTEEMIKEYKDEINKPVVIRDPLTGVESSYKYHPASTIPDYEAYPAATPVPDEIVLRADMHDELAKIHVEQLKIDRIRADIGLITNEINTKSYAKPRRNKKGSMSTMQKDAIDAYNKQLLVENEAIKNKLLQDKTDLEALIPLIEADIRVLEGNIAAMEHEIDTIPGIISDNQAAVSKTDADNKLKIANYAEEMKMFNSGQFNTDKLDNETDEDYLDRLKQNAQTPADNSFMEVEAEVANIKKFKENMKHLISSDVDIESIMRSLDVDEIFSINSVFNIIKEQFLKVFGYNNKNIKLDEIRDFLINIAYQKPGF